MSSGSLLEICLAGLVDTL